MSDVEKRIILFRSVCHATLWNGRQAQDWGNLHGLFGQKIRQAVEFSTQMPIRTKASPGGRIP